MERRVAAILAADVVGYSRHESEDERGAPAGGAQAFGQNGCVSREHFVVVPMSEAAAPV